MPNYLPECHGYGVRKWQQKVGLAGPCGGRLFPFRSWSTRVSTCFHPRKGRALPQNLTQAPEWDTCGCPDDDIPATDYVGARFPETLSPGWMWGSIANQYPSGTLLWFSSESGRNRHGVLGEALGHSSVHMPGWLCFSIIKSAIFSNQSH